MKKILLVNDFSQSSSGYGIYGRNLLERFVKDGYDVAELATFVGENDERIKKCNWKVYPNLPSNEQEEKEYNSNFQNSNGKWRFEKTCLDFKPDYVLDIRDVYMYEFEAYSPFRKFYNWIIMGTIDGIPQHPQWLDIYKSADSILCYTNWGKKILNDYGINSFGVAAPSASNKFFPVEHDTIQKIKTALGVDGKVVGSVMRNQPRKLFNELFEGFSKYLSISEEKTTLYCHTTYPDLGWDLADLLIKHNLLSSVIFTYKCMNCQQIFPSYFRDIRSICPFCKQASVRMPDGHNSVDEETMNKIYNMFDCYIQLASREGFGMPQAEAAACDVPVINMNYAGMSDMKDTISALNCEIKGYYLSYPMNMMEALPDTSDLANLIDYVLNNITKDKSYRKSFENNYNSWDNTYEQWKNAVESLEIKGWKKPQLNNPAKFQEYSNINNYEYTEWLMKNVYGVENEYLKARICNDLNNSVTFPGFGGGYMTEDNSMGRAIPFSRVDAYKLMLHQRLSNNFWLNQL